MMMMNYTGTLELMWVDNNLLNFSLWLFRVALKCQYLLRITCMENTGPPRGCRHVCLSLGYPTQRRPTALNTPTCGLC